MSVTLPRNDEIQCNTLFPIYRDENQGYQKIILNFSSFKWLGHRTYRPPISARELCTELTKYN